MNAEKSADTKIKNIMVKDVVYTTIPGSRDDVLELFKEKYVSGVPVVKDGELVGLITRTDLLKNPEEEQTALLMSRDVATITPDATIAEASALVLEKGVRRLPVVKGKKLAGMVTVADMIKTIAGMSIQDPIGDYIEDEVIVVWDSTPLPIVGKIMELAHAKAVPVLDSSLNLAGIIVDRDLINAAVVVDSVEQSDMSAGSDEDAWTWEGVRDTMHLYYGVSRIKLPDIPVKEVMVGDPVTAFHKSEVSKCAKIMVKDHFDQMPVVTLGQKLAGILYDRDLLKALLKNKK